jgi:LEA14-like dessication related protein
MSLIKTGLIIGGVGLIAYAAYNYYKVETDLLQNSQYDITDISIQSFSTSAITLNVGLQLDNGSDINVNLQNLYLDIYLGGQNVGYIMQTIQTPIAPKSTAVIPLTGTVSLSSAFNTVTSQLGSLFSNAGLDIKVTGTVSVSSGFISTTVPVSFEKTVSI